MLSGLNIAAMTETLGERCRRLRESRGWSQEEVVKGVPGMSASALSQLENGRTYGVRPQNLIDLARRFNLTPEELVEGEVELLTPKTAARRQVRRDGLLREVPIVGHAVANPTDEGYFDDMGFPPGAGDEMLPWPTKDPNAYALRVKGDSMQPRIRPGELIVAEPGAAVGSGDDVVVRTRSGRKMVKQLLFQRGNEVTLGSINTAHRPTSISLEEIESMHRIAAIVPRGALVRDDS